MLRLVSEAGALYLPFMLVLTVIRGVNSFLMNTYLYRYVLNALQNGEEFGRIALNVCGMFAFMMLYVILVQFRNFYTEVNAAKVEAHIQEILQKKAMETDLACFEEPEFYNSYVKALAETSERAMKVVNDLCSMLMVFITVFATGALMVSIDPIFLLLAAVPLIGTLCLGKKRTAVEYTKDMESKEEERQKEYVRRVFYLADFAKEMRLTEMYKVMLKRMGESVAELKDISKKYGYTLMWMDSFFAFLLDVVVYAGAILIAAYKALVNALPMGDCFVVINSITNISYEMNSVGNIFVAFRENSYYIENLRGFLNHEVQISENTNGLAAGKHDRLEFINVSYTYEGKSEPALKNISMSVKAGEKIAIVGYNGSGKTTLVKLLLRFYDPTDGTIEYNGHSLKEYCLSSYRGIFRAVFQDYRLFAVSVAENVILEGNLSEQDKREAENALRKTGVYEKVCTLAQGADTIVTKEFASSGAVFSGGESQKIAVARVLVGNPQIVVLDEPASALDPIAENEIYRNILDFCHEKAVIFITHRLSSAIMADRIYMFEKGEIVEQGTHEELLARQGKYAEMWQKQAKNYIGEGA